MVSMHDRSYVNDRSIVIAKMSSSSFGHLEKYSTATTTNFLYLVVFEKSLRISIPHCENGHGLEMLAWETTGMLILLLNH